MKVWILLVAAARMPESIDELQDWLHAQANHKGVQLNKAELVSRLHKARMIITEYM